MKTAIITGASSGIGRATALELAKEGVNLLLLSRNEEKLKHLADEIRSLHEVKVLYIPFDLHKNRNYDLIVNIALENFDSLDILVNNAGIGYAGSIEQISTQDIEKIFWTNLFSHILLTKSVVPYMKQQERGSIVNIISLVAFRPMKYWGLYNASKSAMEGYFKTLRQEVKKYGIDVINVYPGWTDTAFFENAGIEQKVKNSFIKRFMDSPEFVARRVVKAIKKRKKEVYMHWWGWLLAKCHGLLP